MIWLGRWLRWLGSERWFGRWFRGLDKWLGRWLGGERWLPRWWLRLLGREWYELCSCMFDRPKAGGGEGRS